MTAEAGHTRTLLIEVFDPRSSTWSPPEATTPPLTETGAEQYHVYFALIPIATISTHPMVYYPRLHLLPDGQLFCSTALQLNGPNNPRMTFLIDPRTATLTRVGGPPYTPMFADALAPGPPYLVPDPTGVAHMDNVYARAAFPSVLLPLKPPDYIARILICGERQPKFFDTSMPAAGWQSAGTTRPYRMRAYANAVLLPDSSVALVGGLKSERGPFGAFPGTKIGGEDKDAIFEVEQYDPATNEWKTLAASPNRVPRGYHSVALLLPDGRVWIAGSNHDAQRNVDGEREDDKGDARELRMETYSPPYLFREAPDGTTEQAPRPQIRWSRHGAAYVQTFPIFVDEPVDIGKITLIRCASTTHAYSSDQRCVELERVATASDSVIALAPPSPEIAPPGYYLLFVLNRAGTPSVARFIRLGETNPVLNVFAGHGDNVSNIPLLREDLWSPLKPPPRFDFGRLYRLGGALLGQPSLTLKCENAGSGELVIENAQLDGDFRTSTSFFTGEVANTQLVIVDDRATAESPATLKVTFRPQSEGSFTGNLTIATNSEDWAEFSIELRARVIDVFSALKRRGFVPTLRRRFRF